MPITKPCKKCGSLPSSRGMESQDRIVWEIYCYGCRITTGELVASYHEAVEVWNEGKVHDFGEYTLQIAALKEAGNRLSILLGDFIEGGLGTDEDKEALAEWRKIAGEPE